jgi:hypothetical protein
VAYSDLLGRADTTADVPQAVADVLIRAMSSQSTVLELGQRVPVSTKDSRVPIVTEAPTATWLSDDNSLKQVTSAAFPGQELLAEELAAIITIPDAVIEDSSTPIFDTLTPLLSRAAARAIDDAIIFGRNKPSAWGLSMVDDALVAGNVTAHNDTDPSKAVLLGAAQIGADGFNPNAVAVGPGWEFLAAAANSSALVANPKGSSESLPLLLAGMPVRTKPCVWDSHEVDCVIADWSKCLVGIRRDFRLEIFSTGVISDANGVVVQNLLQQDLSAVRLSMRIAYLLAKPVSDTENLAPSPVAIVQPATAGS